MARRRVKKPNPAEIVPSTPVENKEQLNNLEQLNNEWNNVFKKFDNSGDYLIGLMSFWTNNPYVQNQRIKQLKAPPMFMDRDDLETSLNSPQNSEQALRQFSWSLVGNTYLYYKLVRLYSDILTYKYYAYPKFATKEQIGTPRFKSDSKLVHMLLDVFQPSYTFRRIVLESMIEGKKGYVLRLSVDETQGKEKVNAFLLQELPSLWYKITGKTSEQYYALSFNFVYFWQPGVSVEQFPPEFKQYYMELMNVGAVSEEDNKIKVDIAKIPKGFDTEKRDDQWYLWHEIPNGFVFSCDEANAWLSPVFSGLFTSAQDLSSYSQLQTQLASIPLYGVLTGTIPFAPDSKSGTYSNDLRLTPDLVLGMTNQASATLPPGVAPLFLPMTDLKFSQFEEQINSSKIMNDVLQQFIGNAGISGLLSTTAKPSVAQVNASEKIESRFADVLYGQFESFMNLVFNKYVKLEFPWKFHMFGNIFQDADRKTELKEALSLGQSYLLLEYVAYSDLDMEAMNCIGDWIKDTDAYSKFQTLPSAFNNSAGISSPSGRPKVENPESDNTAKSQDSGLNTKSTHNQFSVKNQDLIETIEEIIEENKE